MNFSKQKRFVYEKAFSVKHVIQNLKTYQVASGEVEASDFSKGKTKEDASTEPEQLSVKRKRKRKRRRGYGNRESSKLSKVDDSELFQHSKKEIGDTATTTEVPHGGGGAVAGSLALLAAEYSDSTSGSESESKEGGPHESCTEKIAGSDVGRAVGTCSNVEREILHPPEIFGVPDTILGMYQEASEGESSSSEGRGDAESRGGLGFFESVDTDDERTENQRSSQKATDREGKGTWDATKAKWKFPTSNLQTYICANCNKIGHFTQDCTVGSSSQGISGTLKNLYASGRKIASQKCIQCADCGLTSNLACCLECRSVYCDGHGHLSSHLYTHPKHVTLYSCKLRKLIKCCKATCEVVSVYNLLVCSHCLSKAFTQHYSMVTACWSGAGFRKIQNAIACEEHFHWHRINCPSSHEDHFITRDKLQHKIVSEFHF